MTLTATGSATMNIPLLRSDNLLKTSANYSDANSLPAIPNSYRLILAGPCALLQFLVGYSSIL